MGRANYDAYLEALAGHRAKVEALFERVLHMGATEFDLWALRGDPLSLAAPALASGKPQAAVQ